MTTHGQGHGEAGGGFTRLPLLEVGQVACLLGQADEALEGDLKFRPQLKRPPLAGELRESDGASQNVLDRPGPDSSTKSSPPRAVASGPRWPTRVVHAYSTKSPRYRPATRIGGESFGLGRQNTRAGHPKAADRPFSHHLPNSTSHRTSFRHANPSQRADRRRRDPIRAVTATTATPASPTAAVRACGEIRADIPTTATTPNASGNTRWIGTTSAATLVMVARLPRRIRQRLDTAPVAFRMRD